MLNAPLLDIVKQVFLMKNIPTALLPLIFKYQNPPQQGEITIPGQTPDEAFWAQVYNDLVALDQQLGFMACPTLYRELSPYRSGDTSSFFARTRVVAALIAAAPEIGPKISNMGTYPDHWKLHQFIAEFERNSR